MEVLGSVFNGVFQTIRGAEIIEINEDKENYILDLVAGNLFRPDLHVVRQASNLSKASVEYNTTYSLASGKESCCVCDQSEDDVCFKRDFPKEYWVTYEMFLVIIVYILIMVLTKKKLVIIISHNFILQYTTLRLSILESYNTNHALVCHE